LKKERAVTESRIGKIRDIPSRNCMIKAKDFVEKGDLKLASANMFEALAAFKFLLVNHFADFRTVDMKFVKLGRNIDLPNLFSDFAIKIILGNDEQGIRLLFSIGSSLVVKNNTVVSKSQYPVPLFKDEAMAMDYFNKILRVITEYQDRVPASVWRSS